MAHRLQDHKVPHWVLTERSAHDPEMLGLELDVLRPWVVSPEGEGRCIQL